VTISQGEINELYEQVHNSRIPKGFEAWCVDMRVVPSDASTEVKAIHGRPGTLWSKEKTNFFLKRCGSRALREFAQD
jgi:hypothetical protein